MLAALDGARYLALYATAFAVAALRLTHDQIAALLASPDATRIELDRLDARESLAAFVRLHWHVVVPEPMRWGWAFDAICGALEQISSGKIRRLVINVPPGFSKTLITQVFWPAWEWARGDVGKSHLATSHDLDEALAVNVILRNLVTSDLYRTLWPHVQLVQGERGKKRFSIVGGGRKAATPIGSATGKRANRVVIDDPMSTEIAESDAERKRVRIGFSRAMPSRLNNANVDAIVLIEQRLHVLDCTSIALKLGWYHLCLPMEFEPDHPHQWAHDPRTRAGELLCEAHYSAQSVAELKAAMSEEGGDYAIASQLQQRPYREGGGLFSRLDVANDNAVPFAVQRRYRAWDLAASTDTRADWTVGALLAFGAPIAPRVAVAGEPSTSAAPAGRVAIEHVIRVQMGPQDVAALIRRTAESDGPSVTIVLPIDPAQAGLAQQATFAQLLHGFTVVFVSMSRGGGKVPRARPFAAQCNAGNVALLPFDGHQQARSEIMAFPGGAHDDVIDAITIGYNEAVTSTRPIAGAPMVGPKVFAGSGERKAS